MRTVLIVGPFYGHCDFAPSPAQRLRGYAKYLPEFGWRPVVLAPACRCTVDRCGEPAPGSIVVDDEHVVFDPSDPDALREAIGRLEGDGPVALRPIMAAPPVFRRWAELSAVPEEASDEVRGKMSWHLTPGYEPVGRSPGRPLVRKVVGAYVRAHGFQAALRRMLTSVALRAADALPELRAALGSHGYAPHVHAARAAANRRETPFVAEMRDELWRGWKPLYEGIELARVARAVRSADAVVYPTPQQQARDRWWLRSGSTHRVIEHGFDPDEWERLRAECRPDQGGFTLRFLGTLHPQRHLGPFLEAYASFLEGLDPSERERVVFEYYGPSSDLMGELLRGAPEEVRRRTRVCGRVPREEAVRRMASAHVLVLPTSPGLPGGRFYEYLGSGRPILAVGDEDPYVRDALAETGAGTAAASTEDAARALRRWWPDAPPARGGDPSVLDRYTRRRQARELAELLGELGPTFGVRGPG